MKVLAPFGVFFLIGLLLVVAWVLGGGVLASVAGTVAVGIGIIVWAWRQEQPTEQPRPRVPRDVVIGMDQHRLDRDAHVRHLQRGFQQPKGRRS